MNILLFGVASVGKSTIGKALAERMNISFYDGYDELEAYYGKPIRQIQSEYFLGSGFDDAKSVVYGDILTKHPEDKVIAMCPTYYCTSVRKYVRRPDTVSIVLEDSPENIYERNEVFNQRTGERNDDPALKKRLKKKLIGETRKDITFYENTNKHIPLRFNVDGRPVDVCAEKLQELAESVFRNQEERGPVVSLDLK